MWKRIKFYAVSAVILALVATIVYLRYFAPRAGEVHRVVDAPALVKEIQQLNELVTVKYSVQKVIGLKEEKVPFGSESVLLMVQATVLGGVDLSALSTDCVTVVTDQKSATVRLPPPKVMHVFIDDKQTKVWDRSRTWWTPWVALNPELEQNARLAALEAVQAAATEMGILKDAQHNAETTVREFLRVAGLSNVTFEVRANAD
jgi:hypothetical protein